MSTVQQEFNLVRQLGTIMKSKLRANQKKPHWEQESLGYLLERLKEEVNELEEAIKAHQEGTGSVLDTIGEAADVANFAAMIVDNTLRGN